MSTETAVPPQVLWAQRKDELLLTFSIETKDPVVKIEKESVYFKGTSAQDNKVHEVTITLHDNINPEKSAYVNRGRCLEMVLRKEKSGPYWPNLTKDKKKPHYLKIDFNKWQDEDDDEEENTGNGNEMDLSEMLKAMGGGAAGGGGDIPDKPSFDDLESDSDDENLPDLE